MAFKPSYNIMDRDTHNALVNAFQTGGIAYTDDDGTVHKIADDYVNASGGGSDLPVVTEADAGKVLAVNASGEWAAESPYDFIVHIQLAEGNFSSATSDYMAPISYFKNKIDNHKPITGIAYATESDLPDETHIYAISIVGMKEIDGDDVYYDIRVNATIDFENFLSLGYSLDSETWYEN